jgi:hypothetical protein
MWPYIIAAPYFMAQSNSLIIPYLHLSHPYTGVEEEGKEGEYQWVCTTPPFSPKHTLKIKIDYYSHNFGWITTNYVKIYVLVEELWLVK